MHTLDVSVDGNQSKYATWSGMATGVDNKGRRRSWQPPQKAAAPTGERASISPASTPLSPRTVQPDNKLPTLFVVLHVNLRVARIEGVGLCRLRHRSPPSQQFATVAVLLRC